jgi:bla regulator protein blaR1
VSAAALGFLVFAGAVALSPPSVALAQRELEGAWVELSQSDTLANTKPDDSDRFEVASIRPSAFVGGRPSMEVNPAGDLHATNVTLKLLIQIAYDIRPEQLVGGPAWADSDEYSVSAKAPDAPVLPEDTQHEVTRHRLQNLLSERFHLMLALKAQTDSAYVLTVGKRGPAMTLTTNSGSGLLRQLGRWELRAEGVDMPLFVRFLGVHLSAAVIDRTELAGRFNFRLKWNPLVRDGESVNSPEVGERAKQSLVTAVQTQLGLRLDRQRMASDRYSIEGAERPTEN